MYTLSGVRVRTANILLEVGYYYWLGMASCKMQSCRLLNVWAAECQANCLGIPNLIQNNLRIYKFENFKNTANGLYHSIPDMYTLYPNHSILLYVCIFINIMCVYICHKSVCLLSLPLI